VHSSVKTIQDNRRRQKFAHLRLFCYLLCLAVVLGGLSYLLHRPWVHFGKIEVIDDGKAFPVEEVIKVADIKQPINLFNVSRGHVEEVLTNDLRVESVSTGYAWPNILKVTIAERKPAVYVECAYGGYAKLSYKGVVLEVSNGIKDATAPFVSGWKLGNIYTGDKVEDEGMLALLDFLGKVDPSVQARIAEIVMESGKKLRILLSNGIPIILGDYDDLPNKVDTFNTVYKELETKKVKAAYIDLSFDKPYIKLR
jgi:cell division protein FtsQ